MKTKELVLCAMFIALITAGTFIPGDSASRAHTRTEAWRHLCRSVHVHGAYWNPGLCRGWWSRLHRTAYIRLSHRIHPASNREWIIIETPAKWRKMASRRKCRWHGNSICVGAIVFLYYLQLRHRCTNSDMGCYMVLRHVAGCA